MAVADSRGAVPFLLFIRSEISRFSARLGS